ncbi:MAG: TrmH family RNA methyltransferase [Anaerovoracaceae bacterium]
MKTITSQDNKLYKSCFLLKQKKNRDKTGKYLIEGPNLVADALRSGVFPELILVSEESLSSEEISGLCSEYEEKSDGGKERIYVLSEKLFCRLSETENPQGILGVVRRKEFSDEAFFEETEGGKNGATNIIVLDRLQDPGNVGTILRTAEAAGYGGVMVIKGTVDLFSPKTVRSCTGSVFRMPVIFKDTPQEALESLKSHGKKVVSTGLEESVYYYDTDLKKDVAVIVGNEGNGVCTEFMEGADVRVKIPMQGQTESLNASIAAAILMYEAVRPYK